MVRGFTLKNFAVVFGGSLLMAQVSWGTPSWNPESLHRREDCLLQLVRSKMKSTADSQAPSLRLESETPLIEFQDAIELAWGSRPDRFGNVFVPQKNTIYLLNRLDAYRSPRTPVDSLVHELVHFVQVMDRNGGQFLGLDQDQLEVEAVAIQTWFRETHPVDELAQDYLGECR